MPSINPGNTASSSSAHRMPPGMPPMGGREMPGEKTSPGDRHHTPNSRSPPEGGDPRMMGGYPPYPGYYAPMSHDSGKPGQYPPQHAPYPHGGPPYHPMQGSYGPPGHSGQGGPMPYGSPMFGGAHGPFPPYGPPPQRGHGNAPPNWYGYNAAASGGPDGASPPPPNYPSQEATAPGHGPGSRSSRGGRAPPNKLPYSPPRLREKSSPPEPQDSAEIAAELTRKMDDLEKERVRNSEAAELSLSEVKPIQTDYHFFVATVRDKLKLEAEDEVRKTNKGKLDPFLVNTNLNCRIMKEWENLKKEERERYMEKEEADRRRFMEEDEVASRHCFTLTARIRTDTKKAETQAEKNESRTNDVERNDGPDSSPSNKEDDKSREEQENKRTQEAKGSPEESPAKKNRLSEASDATPV